MTPLTVPILFAQVGISSDSMAASHLCIGTLGALEFSEIVYQGRWHGAVRDQLDRKPQVHRAARAQQQNCVHPAMQQETKPEIHRVTPAHTQAPQHSASQPERKPDVHKLAPNLPPAAIHSAARPERRPWAIPHAATLPPQPRGDPPLPQVRPLDCRLHPHRWIRLDFLGIDALHGQMRMPAFPYFKRCF